MSGASSGASRTRVGSLCSGYGGLELGLALALGDVEVAWHVEYDKHPSAILAHRYPGVPNYGDVKHTDWSAVEPVDWLTAGYPCQPFSLAGLRKGADDPRHLWPGVASAIGALRPRGVLLENVAAHLRDGFDVVLGDLAALGYDARWGVVRASDAGAPHGRARVFIVAADTHDDAGRRAGPGRPRQVASMEGGAGRPGHPDGAGPARDGSADLAAHAYDLGHERLGLARDGRPGPADGSLHAPNAACDGRREGRPEPARLVGRPHAAECGLSAPADTDHADGWGSDAIRRAVGRDVAASGGEGRVEWGAYEPAIRRWERVTGRPAPRPTEPGRRGERLSPRFVEWMQGLPEGWVTDVPGLPRNAMLKALGNGVVPQQAALACRLLGVTAEAVAA